MYTALPHLQLAIRNALQKGALCRIYNETLSACWPNLAEELRAQKIAEFAAQNHWCVNYRTLGHLGLVAEFQKGE